MSVENNSNVAVLETPTVETTPAKKVPTPRKKAEPKPAPVAKATPAPKGKKPVAAKKEEAAPTTEKKYAPLEKVVAENGKVIVPAQVEKEIRWTPAKVNLLASMKKLGATSSSTARSIEEIAKASGGKLEEKQVKHQVNPLFDLSQQEILKRAKMEDGMKYYLTAKGLKIANKS